MLGKAIKSVIKPVAKDVGKFAVEKAFPIVPQLGQFAGYQPSKLSTVDDIRRSGKYRTQQAAATMNKKAALDHFISEEELSIKRDRVKTAAQQPPRMSNELYRGFKNQLSNQRETIDSLQQTLEKQRELANSYRNRLRGQKVQHNEAYRNLQEQSRKQVAELKDRASIARDSHNAKVTSLQNKINTETTSLNAEKNKNVALQTQLNNANDKLRGTEHDREVAKRIAFNKADRRSKLITGGTILGLGTLAALGIVGANKYRQKMRADKTWKSLQMKHPEVTRSQKDKDNFEILKQYAPALAANPDVAYSYLVRVKQTGMVPHEFIKDLIKIQKDRSSGGLADKLLSFAPGKVMG